MSKSLVFLIVVVVAVVALYGGYWYGGRQGYDKGYDSGLTDAARVQTEAEGAEVKIDTGYTNPYEDVNLNPFK